LGVGLTKFDEMVADGRMPKPKTIDSCVVWDRVRLDDAFESLPDQSEKLDRGRWKVAT
jgi:predicted DNA-binding transcriptional regulator AlpA